MKPGMKFYVISGKYGQDFGIIEEECFKYTGKDSPCKQTSCKRYYTRDYYYVGGFYGGCNEPLVREELVKNGPIAISFQVYNDFVHYKVGILINIIYQCITELIICFMCKCTLK
jgi:cathepsin C